MKTHSFPTNSQADMCAGPWETSTQDENGIDILSSPSLEDPQQYRIAHVVPWPGVEEIARLMAAAPELYAACEEMVLILKQQAEEMRAINPPDADSLQEYVDRAEAAMLKARKGSL